MDLTGSIIARDCPEAWFLCLRAILVEGRRYTIDKGSFAGHDRIELDWVNLCLTHPSNRPLSPQLPPYLPDVIAPVTDTQIEEYAQTLLQYHPVGRADYHYGEFLNPQVDEVIRQYKEGGFNSNRLCMMLGDMHSVFAYRDETGQREVHSPCLRVVDTAIRDGALHFYCYFRSWDAWAGLPSNLGGLALLMEFMAEILEVSVGMLRACSKGLHLYDFEETWARAVCGEVG